MEPNWFDLDPILSTKMTISRKIKIWILIFHSFKSIPHLSRKFQNFWKKNVDFFFSFFFLVGGFAPHIPHRACTLETRFRIENPSQNRLVSTAYFAKPVMLSLLLLLTTAKYKIGHNSKTKNHMQKSQGFKNFDHNIVQLFSVWPKKMTHNTWKLWTKSVIIKKKNWFFFHFSFVSERFSTIWSKKIKTALFDAGGMGSAYY